MEWLCLGEQLGADHRAKMVEDEVNRLDLEALHDAYRGSGSAAYRPDLMLKMVLLEYLNGRTSPAQWHRDAQDSLPLQWLGRGIAPSRTAWYDFRDRLGDLIQTVHARLIAEALAEGLAQATTGVQDGSTFRAAASRHRLVNQATLEKRQAILQAAIARDSVGEPVESMPGWMAKRARGRADQARRVEQACDVVQQRIAENAKKPKDKRGDPHRIQVSLSEPEAPLGRDKEKVFCPLYTAQFLVEPESFLVIGWDVFAQASDAGTLEPIIDRTQAVVGGRLKKIIADAAYATLLDLQMCHVRHINLIAPVQENSFTQKRRAAANPSRGNRDQFEWLPAEQTYRCPQGHLLKYRGKQQKRRRAAQHVIEYRYHCSPEHCQGCPLAATCVRDASKGRIVKRLEGQELLEAQREKMKGDAAKADYRLRSSVVERAFADVKGHRGFRRFHGRGLARAKAETGLLALAQNILALYRLRKSTANHNDHVP